MRIPKKRNWKTFMGEFNGPNDVAREYQTSIEGIDFLFAFYGQGNYEGSSEVVFEKDGELFTVSCGHCSCYGLEGQFTPVLSSIKTLRHIFDQGSRYKPGYFFSVEETAEFEKMLVSLETANKTKKATKSQKPKGMTII